MSSAAHTNAGRNDPCPCGSGKKYKRCCLAQQTARHALWARQRQACDELTRDMMRFAEQKLGEQMESAWRDFHLTDLPVPYDPDAHEQQIFMPYFLFHWDPLRPRSGKGALRRGSLVMRWYEMERARELSDLERALLDQATTQPVSFHEVLWSEPGERIGLRDVLLGTGSEVYERLGSRGVERGDMVYGQIWNLEGIATLGAMAPLCIPPAWKADVISLRKRLRKKIAKEGRDLAADDLVRYADTIRLTYLTIRGGLFRRPQVANTDGEPLVFHTLKFRIESAEVAFQRLAPLAFGQTREELLEGAKFGADGKLESIALDWRKKGNRKIPSWENTILGHIQIAGHELTAEVNSAKRASRLRTQIERRLGASATHESTTHKSLEEMLAHPSRVRDAQARKDDAFAAALLRDPEVRSRMQATIQKQVADWVHMKIPVLGGRTPMEAVRDPDDREIVEALLLDWERQANAGAFQAGLRPDFNAVRKLLNLAPATP